MQYKKFSLNLHLTEFLANFSLKFIFIVGLGFGSNLLAIADEINTIEHWEKVVAENPDDAQAWFNIAVLYELGQGGVERDLEKAEQYHKKSVALDYAPASFNIGAIYAQRKDYENAIKWWEKASLQSVPEAQYNLAWLYEKGVGVDQNPQMAVKLYEQSAQTAMNKYFRLFQESKNESGSAAGSVPEFQARSGWDWVTRQSQANYTIQLSASKREDKTFKFIQRFGLENQVIVIPAIIKGSVYYKVVLGSFKEWNDAAQKLDSLPQNLREQKPWIRSFNSLKPEMPESIRQQLQEQALSKTPPQQLSSVKTADKKQVEAPVEPAAEPEQVRSEVEEKLVNARVYGPIVAEPVIEAGRQVVIKKRPAGSLNNQASTGERVVKNTIDINIPSTAEQLASTDLDETTRIDKTTTNSAVAVQRVNDPGWDWVLKQPQENYTIQLAASERQDKTLKFIQQYALKSQVKVIPAIVKGSKYYKVVLGSFKEWNDAALKIGGLAQDLRDKKPWIRSFASLKLEMPERIKLQLQEQALSRISIQEPVGVETTIDEQIESVVEHEKAESETQEALAKTQVQSIITTEPSFEVDTASAKESPGSSKKKLELIEALEAKENSDIYNPYTLKQLASKGLDEAAREELKSALSAIEMKDYALAFGLFDGLAKKGLPEALYRQAWLYSDGLGIEQDNSKAFNLARLAAEQGHPYSQKMLAGFYLNGSGVEENTALAEYWRQTSEDNIKRLNQ